MRVPLILALLLIVSPVYAANIEFATSETEAYYEPLKIVCPKCGAVMYVCKVDVIYRGQSVISAGCQPLEGYVKLIPGVEPPVCKFCGGHPMRMFDSHDSSEGYGVNVYTNKGWMPR